MALLDHGSPPPTSTAIPTKHRNGRKPRRKPGRLLYRRGVTADELDRLIEEIGLDRMLAAVDRYTRPELPFVMAEGGGA